MTLGPKISAFPALSFFPYGKSPVRWATLGTIIMLALIATFVSVGTSRAQTTGNVLKGADRMSLLVEVRIASEEAAECPIRESEIRSAVMVQLSRIPVSFETAPPIEFLSPTLSLTAMVLRISGNDGRVLGCAVSYDANVFILNAMKVDGRQTVARTLLLNLGSGMLSGVGENITGRTFEAFERLALEFAVHWGLDQQAP